MGFRVLMEEEERHSILEEGIAQQLQALIGDVLLASLGSEGFQHIHDVGLPAHMHRHTQHGHWLVSNTCICLSRVMAHMQRTKMLL